MKKIMRYLLTMVVALIVILVFVNIPKLATAMLETVSAVSWQDWMKYVIGIIIGTVSTGFAMKSKKVIIDEDISDDI